MADPVMLARLKRRLEEVWMATPKTAEADVWGKLAEVAAEESGRVVSGVLRPLPVAVFLVAQKPPRADGVRILAQCESVLSATATALDYLQREGAGTVWVLEIKRILEAR